MMVLGLQRWFSLVVSNWPNNNNNNSYKDGWLYVCCTYLVPSVNETKGDQLVIFL